MSQNIENNVASFVYFAKLRAILFIVGSVGKSRRIKHLSSGEKKGCGNSFELITFESRLTDK